MKKFKFLVNTMKMPLPMNISILWNYGSLLGMCLIIQLISGLLLSMHYCPNIALAFNSVMDIMKNIWFGWIFRLIHLNGASMFFIILYIHVGRGMYYNSFKLKLTWIIGTMMMFMMMMIAFMGYILPWGQMSYWGATVITNLISTIPLIGNKMVIWIWGGFTINNATLNRFYSIHFIAPFILIILIFLHLYFLHQKGSSNPLGINSNMNKIYFHPYFTFKDMTMFILISKIFIMICLMWPYMVNDPENFIMANSMITPMHIQPEWYFLFAYSILRTIPNKFGGVIMLMLSIMILLILPTLNLNVYKMIYFNPLNKLMFWMFTNLFILLTWAGMMPITHPYTFISQFITLLYFMYFMMLKFINKFWEKIFNF